jgi:hypothetical protein
MSTDEITNEVNKVLNGFLFEQNDLATRTKINYSLSQALQPLTAACQIICDATNNTSSDVDSGRLNVDVYITQGSSVTWTYIKASVIVANMNIDNSDKPSAINILKL